MSKRYVTLGCGRRVTLASYVAVVKAAKANPDATFPRCLRDRWPVEGREIVEQFTAGMIDRINAGVPYIARGAKT